MKSIEEKVKELPLELQQEVEDFIDFLLERRGKKKQKKLRMSWARRLQEFCDQYTALELQKKALEWWGD